MNINEVKGTALVLTDDLYTTKAAKTAHGLVRGTERFEILGIIDTKTAGQDAGQTLDNTFRNIPTFVTFAEAIKSTGRPDYAIIGIATPGGVLPPPLLEQVKSCIREGVSIVNGLHDCLVDHPEVVELAKKHNAQLHDIRKPKKYNEYNFWSPDIYKVTTPIVAVMGTDCSVGKRTSCRMIQEACDQSGINATMIYTGQTGWMQGYKYGFVLDSTLNDFVSGELCHAVLSADQNESPDIILMEGQAALRNPSGPCGAEYLVSANAKRVILVHEEKEYYHDEPSWGPVKTLESEIQLIEAYGAKVIGLCLNTADISEEEGLRKVSSYKAKYNLPVVAPLIHGVDELMVTIKAIIDED